MKQPRWLSWPVADEQVAYRVLHGNAVTARRSSGWRNRRSDRSTRCSGRRRAKSRGSSSVGNCRRQPSRCRGSPRRTNNTRRFPPCPPSSGTFLRRRSRPRTRSCHQKLRQRRRAAHDHRRLRDRHHRRLRRVRRAHRRHRRRPIRSCRPRCLRGRQSLPRFRRCCLRPCLRWGSTHRSRRPSPSRCRRDHPSRLPPMILQFPRSRSSRPLRCPPSPRRCHTPPFPASPARRSMRSGAGVPGSDRRWPGCAWSYPFDESGLVVSSRP